MVSLQTISALAAIGLFASLTFAAEAGKSLYANRCVGCHGAAGKGSQTMAKALQANIPDLTSKEIAKKPDAKILDALKQRKGEDASDDRPQRKGAERSGTLR
jgi:mono/diheme cytochrome c family protein